MWAGWNAVSVLENLTGSNFLSNGGLIPSVSHSDGTPPYIYTTPGDPFMQFIGTLDGATANGPESIYIPGSLGWRSTTTVAVYDPNYTNSSITYSRNNVENNTSYTIYIIFDEFHKLFATKEDSN